MIQYDKILSKYYQNNYDQNDPDIDQNMSKCGIIRVWDRRVEYFNFDRAI